MHLLTTFTQLRVNNTTITTDGGVRLHTKKCSQEPQDFFTVHPNRKHENGYKPSQHGSHHNTSDARICCQSSNFSLYIGTEDLSVVQFSFRCSCEFPRPLVTTDCKEAEEQLRVASACKGLNGVLGVCYAIITLGTPAVHARLK